MSPLPQKTLTTRYVSLSLSLLLFLTFSDDTFSTPPSALFPEQVHHAVVPAQQHVPHVLQAGRARVRELPAAHGGGHETLHQNVSSRHPRTPLEPFPQADLPSFHFSRHHPGLRGRTRSLRPPRARRRESMQPREGYSTRRILAPGPPIALRGWPQDPPGGPTRVPSPSTTRRRPPRRGGGPAPAASRLSRRILGRYSGPGRARSEARSSGTGSFFLPAFAFATCNTIQTLLQVERFRTRVRLRSLAPSFARRHPANHQKKKRQDKHFFI